MVADAQSCEVGASFWKGVDHDWVLNLERHDQVAIPDESWLGVLTEKTSRDENEILDSVVEFEIREDVDVLSERR